MTVCLTGDVHHATLGTGDQAYMDQTEIEVAIEYAEIAAEKDVPVTLFCTGKTAVESPGAVHTLAAMDNVELGGHNYWAFDTLAHKASRGLLGTWNGPARFQDWEIRKTMDAFADLGVALRSWRDHAYRHDRNTAELLSERGITHFSDAVGPGEQVRREDGLTVVPINTPPDHEHVYHAFRTPEFVAETDFDGPFGAESWPVDEWADRVLDALTLGDASVTRTVLAHPACMKIADDLAAFERLCRLVAVEFDARVVSEVD